MRCAGDIMPGSRRTSQDGGGALALQVTQSPQTPQVWNFRENTVDYSDFVNACN